MRTGASKSERLDVMPETRQVLQQTAKERHKTVPPSALPNEFRVSRSL